MEDERNELLMNPPSHTEWVYGNLLNAFRQAHRNGDKDKADRIDMAISVIDELWPEDCRRWEARFAISAHQ